MEKEINNFKAWLILGISILIALGVLFYANSNFYQEFFGLTEDMRTYIIPKKPEAKHAVIKFDFGNGQKRAFRSDLDGGVYGLKYSLDLIAKAGKFSWQEKNDWVENLAGIGGTAGVWQAYRNEKPVQKSLRRLTVTGGDNYMLRFEK